MCTDHPFDKDRQELWGATGQGWLVELGEAFPDREHLGARDL